LRVAGIGYQREQTEAAAEHILALGHPGHRFDAQRVESEQRRHQQAPPRRASHQSQPHEDQRGVERVQQHAGQVMSPRVQTEHLAIQHVREPGDGMPVAGVVSAKCPPGIPQGQSAGHGRVILHVFTRQKPIAPPLKVARMKTPLKLNVR